MELLVNLGALTPKEELTELGEYLAALPVDPRLGKMILYGAAFQVLDPSQSPAHIAHVAYPQPQAADPPRVCLCASVLTVASCLAYRDPFVLPMEQDRRAAQEVRQRLSHGSQCDLITLLHAFNGYQQVAASGQSTFGYCRSHFLQPASMSMIAEMKRQFFLILRDVGLLEDPSPSTPSTHRQSVESYYNQRSSNMDAVHAVIVSALYPNAAKVSYAGKKGTKPQLSTRDLLTNVRIHPSSVNSMRDLDPMRARVEEEGQTGADDEDDDDDDGEGEVQSRGMTAVKGLAPWLMYYEVMRSSQVFLRCTSLASPLLVSLIASSAQSEAKLTETKDVELSEDDEGDDDDDDDDAEADEEGREGEEGEDDEGGDEVFIKPNGSSLPPPSSAAPATAGEAASAEKSKVVNVDLDGFIRYCMTREDAARLQAVRRYLQWLLHQRILASHIHIAHGASRAAKLQHQQTAAVEDQREDELISLIIDVLREDTASRLADRQRQLQPAPPPLYFGGSNASSVYGTAMREGRGGSFGSRGGPQRGRGGAGEVRVLSSAAPVFAPSVSPQQAMQPGWQRMHAMVDRGGWRGGRGGARGGGMPQPAAYSTQPHQAHGAPSAPVASGDAGRGRGRGQHWKPTL